MSVIPLLDALTPIVQKVLGFIPDPQQKEQAQEFLITSLKEWDAQQAQIDQQEAQSQNLFIAGWRPFIGWVCGAAFAYHFILLPILESLCMAMGYKVQYPVFDMQELTTVLMGMLGLGSLRTIEKIKGVD